jgi:hypothetical protein
MTEHDLHPGLERRLAALAERIAKLRASMNHASGATKIEAFGEQQELETRYRHLSERLAALNREGPGFRQNLTAEWQKLADDLTGNIENFTLRVDSGFSADRRPKKPSKG